MCFVDKGGKGYLVQRYNQAHDSMNMALRPVSRDGFCPFTQKYTLRTRNHVKELRALSISNQQHTTHGLLRRILVSRR